MVWWVEAAGWTWGMIYWSAFDSDSNGFTGVPLHMHRCTPTCSFDIVGQMMMLCSWFALSPSDDLSQDPTPSSTCASPELPPHVQQQPVEEEEIDKNEVAREDSSVKNGICLVCVRISLYYGLFFHHWSFPHPKWSPVADSPPQRSDSPPKLPSHVRPETSKEERLAKDSRAESGMCMYCIWALLCPLTH